MATRIAPQIKDKIELSDAEHKLCNLLDEFTRHLKHQDGIVTACRINGGWVRDKVNLGPLSAWTCFSCWIAVNSCSTMNVTMSTFVSKT